MAIKKSRVLHVDVRRADEGTYIAEVRELDGCFAGGDTVEEALSVLREVIADYLYAVNACDGVELGEYMQVTHAEAGVEDVLEQRELVLA